MKTERSVVLLTAALLSAALAGCDQSSGHSHGPDGHTHASPSQTDTHAHADGTTHAGADEAHRHDSPAPSVPAGTHTHADGSVHAAHGNPAPAAAPSAPAGTHTHADGSVHAAHGSAAPAAAQDAHAVQALPDATVGDMTLKLGQGHGAIVAGQESHLVVTLPYNDNGATSVRAWIGTEDRTLSYVGRGDYTAPSNVYDIHAIAPSPLPANTMWWIEIEKPDGTRAVGSATPLIR